jgi:cytochrome c-type biogenesis protein CcmH
MALWFILAMMSAAAIFAVLWPLGRRGRVAVPAGQGAVYRDQLDEIGRDAASGLIGPEEAEAARIEIARRLIAASGDDRTAFRVSAAARRAISIVALAGIPLVALAIYLPLGSPFVPDQPLAARATAPAETDSVDRLVSQVEAHLERSPTDARGWAVLAPVLLKLGRTEDAVRAYRHLITHGGENAERRADLGEAMVAAANGVVTSDAAAEFTRAAALDADLVKPRYFLGLAAEQDGRAAEAATIWRSLLAQAPGDAPWREGLQAALARVEGKPVPDGAIEAAAALEPGARDAMIRGMVERLAARLVGQGGDPGQWLRLVRAYIVLGERDKAKSARDAAQKALAAQPQALRQFDEGVRPLGLDG